MYFPVTTPPKYPCNTTKIKDKTMNSILVCPHSITLLTIAAFSPSYRPAIHSLSSRYPLVEDRHL